MRDLQGEELRQAKIWMLEAVEEGKKSPCEKSKRGVVIVRDGEIIGRGYNRPPLEINCEPENCREICSDYCLHAEENAITDAMRNMKSLKGSTMYHIKVKNGQQTYSEGPSCARCSSKVYDHEIANFTLRLKQGYGIYSAEEFHQLSLNAIRKSNSRKELSDKIGGTTNL